MHTSSKISNSVLVYLESRNFKNLEFNALSNVSDEFLRDSSFWVDSDQMEDFLEEFENKTGFKVAEVGRASAELRAWGVLNGVLQMMDNPVDLLVQPERFFSYFFQPHPKISNLIKKEAILSKNFPGLTIEFHISSELQALPKTKSFIQSSIEALPLFMGQNLATVKWEGKRVKIFWNKENESLLGREEKYVKPEFLRDLMNTLEIGQKELESKNKIFIDRNAELEAIKKQLEDSLRSQIAGTIEMSFEKMDAQFGELQQQTEKLKDYLLRAYQLVTLLVGQGRQDPQVKEAMRRVDWNQIQKKSPELIQAMSQLLLDMRNQLKAKESQQKNEIDSSQISLMSFVENKKYPVRLS